MNIRQTITLTALFKLNNDVPVDDAILNGFTPAAPLILKVYADEVALIPATVPLSINVPDESVEGDVHRARYPFVPPKTLELTLSDDVDTHCIPLPVVWSIIPAVPELPFTLSAPVVFISPAIVRGYDGVVVPMPTLPDGSITIRDKLFVTK